MSYWRLFYHVVWGTKQREPSLTDEREAVLRHALPGIARTDDALIHAIGVMSDHIHVVISVPPKQAVADVVNRLKGASSHLLAHDEHAAPHEGWTGWQPEYGVLSFAESNLPAVVRYAVNQREHHASKQLKEAMERFSSGTEPAPDKPRPGQGIDATPLL